MASKPIVAGTDGSEESLRAVDWAAREAVLRGAPLRIVSAAALPPRMISRAGAGEYDTVTDVITKQRDRALAAAAELAARAAPGLLIDTDPLSGAPAEAVTASGAGALMLVLGSRGVGAFTAMLLGSVSRYAASHASCPVVAIRDETPGPHRLVGVGVGDPDSCADALTFAFEEASLRQAACWPCTPGTPRKPTFPGPARRSRRPARRPPRRTRPGSSKACSTAGGLSTPTSRSARTSCTATRPGR